MKGGGMDGDYDRDEVERAAREVAVLSGCTCADSGLVVHIDRDPPVLDIWYEHDDDCELLLALERANRAWTN